MRFRPSACLLLACTLLRADNPGGIAGVHGHREDAPWSLSLGLAPLSFPKYPGAAENRRFLFPLVDLEAGRFHAGASRLEVPLGQGLGVLLARRGPWRWDLELDWTDRRPEGRGPALAGLGDRRAGLVAATRVIRAFGGLQADLGLQRGLRDRAGTVALLKLGWSGELGPRGFGSLAILGRWGDGAALAYDFGVSPTQSTVRSALAATGDPRLAGISTAPYDPGPGLRDLGLQGALGWRPAPSLAPGLRVFAFGQAVRLGPAPRRSPLVLKDRYTVAGLGFTVRI